MPPGLEKPVFEKLGDVYRYTWPATGVRVELDYFNEAHGDLYAELTFAKLVGAEPVFLADTRLNITSSDMQSRLAKKIAGKHPGVEWDDLLGVLCFLAKNQYRNGDPPIDLMAQDPPARKRWVVKPYWEASRPTTLFGPGGSNKTYIGDAWAVSLATTAPIVGIPAADQRIKTLLVDYESDDSVHYERVLAIQRGHGLPDNLDGWIFYDHPGVPLVNCARRLRRFIAERGIGAVIIDSLSLACGGDLEESRAILQTFAAAISLGVPFVFLSHVTKAGIETAKGGANRLSPFGSIYTENQSGNTWSVVRDGDEGAELGHLALVHEKTNWKYQKRHGYKVLIENNPGDPDELQACTFSPEQLGDAGYFTEKQTLTQRCLAVLSRGEATTEALYEAIPDATPGSIRGTLARLELAKEVERHGRGTFRLLGPAHGYAPGQSA